MADVVGVAAGVAEVETALVNAVALPMTLLAQAFTGIAAFAMVVVTAGNARLTTASSQRTAQ